MDALDLVLIALCLVVAVSGYRQGFIVGVLAAVGFLGGGALGVKYAPELHSHFASTQSAPFGLAVVVVAAVLGQLIATAVGVALRRLTGGLPALRLADSVAGAAVSVVPLLLVAWIIGTSIAHSAASGVSEQVRDSAVLRGVDAVVPADARTWFAPFRRLLDENDLPEVFGGIGQDRVTPVAPPNPKLARSHAVQVAQPDVVKITGDAAACSRRLEGSGFVYATDRIMTNAHVVAGVRSPTVQTSDGRTLPAVVVRFDPNRDVAVLDVPGLDRTPLGFGGALARGRSAVVVGYPEDGPFTAGAARIRAVEQARGPNIYQDREVTRQVYSLYAVVRPGNSGGPLLTPGGSVAGVVFAAAVGDAHTGYALTAAEVAPDAAAGRSATAAVSTGGCD
jgi:S1-C subfamily serine protease